MMLGIVLTTVGFVAALYLQYYLISESNKNLIKHGKLWLHKDTGLCLVVVVVEV